MIVESVYFLEASPAFVHTEDKILDLLGLWDFRIHGILTSVKVML